jgi:hypothetical protein
MQRIPLSRLFPQDMISKVLIVKKIAGRVEEWLEHNQYIFPLCNGVSEPFITTRNLIFMQ